MFFQNIMPNQSSLTVYNVDGVYTPDGQIKFLEVGNGFFCGYESHQKTKLTMPETIIDHLIKQFGFVYIISTALSKKQITARSCPDYLSHAFYGKHFPDAIRYLSYEAFMTLAEEPKATIPQKPFNGYAS